MGNPSDIIGLCLRLPTWSAPSAIPTFRPKRRKPFALYVLAFFWPVMTWPIQGKKKLIIAEWSYQGDIGQGELLLPSNGRDTSSRSKSVPQRLKPSGVGYLRHSRKRHLNLLEPSWANPMVFITLGEPQAHGDTAEAVPFVERFFRNLFCTGWKACVRTPFPNLVP